MEQKLKLIRITTVPISLRVLLNKQLRFMASYFDVLAVSSPGKVLEEVGYNEGVRTAAVTMTRAITPAKDAQALIELVNLFKKEKPAIVHTHTPKAGLLGMMAAKIAGVPIRLHTVAGLPLMESTGAKRKLLEFTEKLTYQFATHVLPNSKNLATFIEQQKFCAIKKITVLGNGSSNGIDTDFFKPTPELQITATALREQLQIAKVDFVFVFIGRLVKDKGIEELVQAFINLSRRHGQLKLLLVGPFEPELDPINSETKHNIEINEHIIHTGFQQDVRPYYMISNALVFPSYREGFPNVPMQAGCFNLPSIVTNINGCNEIIEDGVNGVIIPPKNEAALERAMENLLTDTTLYQRLKSNARALIVERYNQNHFWQLLLQQYKTALNQKAIVSSFL